VNSRKLIPGLGLFSRFGPKAEVRSLGINETFDYAGFELIEHQGFESVSTDGYDSDHGQLEEQLRVALDMSPCPAFFVSLDGCQILATNHAATEFFQSTEQALRGSSLRDFIPERDEAEFMRLIQAFQADQKNEGALAVSAADGVGLSRMRLRIVGDVVVVIGQTMPGTRSGTVQPVQDIDPLTGLMNRRRLEQRVQQAIDGDNNDWGILFIDLNDYKQVNDLYGHVAGDRVLVEFAKKLEASSRPGDLVARYGGDEFVVFVDRISSQVDLRSMADRIAVEVNVEVLSSEPLIVVTASIGCAMATDGLASIDEIISTADRDMYRAKRKNPR
jgi:diguanylate cyclase (GGDEF)-like protein